MDSFISISFGNVKFKRTFLQFHSSVDFDELINSSSAPVFVSFCKLARPSLDHEHHWWTWVIDFACSSQFSIISLVLVVAVVSVVIVVVVEVVAVVVVLVTIVVVVVIVVMVVAVEVEKKKQYELVGFKDLGG
ncbi:hypothetical protein ElyMa_006579600 [Elysia marginata]|uniref:Transmembrane protein n=1 Tax=Elysia marginata TaxID=1093978 RepID=A0AAV4ID74_9GAST|nr:hypothetical protein ElyMa_006579600 [Elysia marginata]